ncbi:DUF2877 domain-containing protein [Sporomusa sphaeroides]|uniref:DUF2877 domain-containing protein n=2 Tax=Sporomusa sphaeroides TaxID=47679 RepID=UPI003DA117F2
MNRDEVKYHREAKSNLLPLYLKNVSMGKVHSKFNSGLNLQMEEHLLYIGCCSSPLSAFGLNIDEAKLRQLLAAVRIGDLVRYKEDVLIFYSIQGTITLACQELAEVDLRLPAIACTRQKIADSRLYNYLAAMEFEPFIGIDLDEQAGRHVELLQSTDKTDGNANSRVIRFFVGRGKGLTPSGDDLLIGFTLALLLFGPFQAWKQALAGEVTGERTTLISVAYCRALLAGYASEPFIRLVKLLDTEELAAIEKTIKEVQAFGHTSGNDTLFGFFLGLKFIIHGG